MHPIIVIDPDWQLFEHGAGVGFVADASVVALEGSDERLGQVRPCDADRFGNRAHRPSSGNEIERNGSFFGPAARETASRRISFSIVFLPSMRCSSRTWASRAR